MEEAKLPRQSCSDHHFEWQFQDGSGAWIKYGGPEAPAVASDAIEEYFASDPDRLPLFIESRYGTFLLDFQSMTETNKKTSARRKIRRIPKQNDRRSNAEGEPTNAESGSSEAMGLDFRGGFLTNRRKKSTDGRSKFEKSGGGPGSRGYRKGVCGGGNPRIPPPKAKSNGSLKGDFVWQFEDETGAWITYGQTNWAHHQVSGTVDTSDDIEDYHTRFPNQPILITRSQRHEYEINFQTMTQTNLVTYVRRRIRRIPNRNADRVCGNQLASGIAGIHIPESGLASGIAGIHVPGSGLASGIAGIHVPGSGLASGIAGIQVEKTGYGDTQTRFEWQFKDERGVWTSYGQSNSAGYAAAATYTTSADIEKHFTENPGKPLMRIRSSCNKYELNFRTMTQVNLRTKVQRPIRRVARSA